ncbi:thiamine pyrophosphate-dependent enzyme [Bengtsoniella intestinalis]|uniref:thiamine pyrophosphate-dependent enzyme n=1 Tax=Bengtsoniella intestinalis TaxID=3073143 RepID=UPI00391F6641
MAKTLKKPEMINQQVGWCGGCGHGIIQRLIAECCEELGLVEKTIQCVDIACAYWSIDTLNCDGIAGPHGRCAAVATAIKKVHPESNVYVHAGDGCSYVIGLSETCFTAQRDVPITMIVVNNGIFGMTGGQLCIATTLVGDKTKSSKAGRSDEQFGKPFDMLEVLSNYDIEYAARGALYDPKHIDQTKKMLMKGFKNQMENKGFSIIEILSPCPTNWKMSPQESMDKLRDENEKIFPVKEYVDRGGVQNG